MKRKLLQTLSLIMATTTFVSSSLPTMAYELDTNGNSIEHIEYQNSQDEDFSNTTNVFAELASEYKITIPKYIVLSGASKDAKYYVKVNGDIAGYEQIKVVPDKDFNLHTANKQSEKATINQNKIIWKVSDFDTDALGSVSAPNITAGKWTGTFNFNVNLEDSDKVAGDIEVEPVNDKPAESETHTHTPSQIKKENIKEATCKNEGSYDAVIYCDTCGKLISKETITVEKIAHKNTDTRIENKVPATCTEKGSFDEVTYCKDCGEVINTTTKEINALGHDYKEGTCTRCNDSLKDIEYVATGFDGVYDEKPHNISVNSNDGEIFYSTDGKNFVKENPTFTNAGTYKVYYKITKENYKTITGFETVNIKKIALPYAEEEISLNNGEETEINIENVKLTSKDDSIVKIDGNKIISVAPGKTQVIVSKENYEDKIINVTVNEKYYPFKVFETDNNVDLTGTTKNGEYAENSEIKLMASPKKGYKWDSWMLSDNNSIISEQNTTVTMPSSELVAIPCVEAEEYSISYDLDGGEIDNKTTKYTIEDEFVLEKPVKEGFDFIGWTGSNGDTPEMQVVVEKGTTGNLSYKANYSKAESTIKYDSNGGIGNMSDQKVQVAQNSKLNKNTFTNEHFAFVGWSTSPEGEVVYEDEAEINFSSKEDITLFAKWKLDTKGYVLTFDANGGVFDDGNTVNMLGYDPVETTKNTWTLHTSNLADDGTKANTTGINTSLQDEDKTKTVSVPNASKLSVTVKYNPGAYQSGTRKIGRLSKPVYSAYTLTVSDKAGNTIKTLANSNPSLITITESNAQTVTFDVTGNSVTFALDGQNGYGYFATIKGYDASGNEIVTKSYTNKKVTGTYKDPTRTGYILGGISIGSLVKEGNEKTKWKRNADGLDMYVLDENYEPKTEVLADTTIYANWIPKVYTISYNLDGGVLAEKELMYKVGDGDIVIGEPTKAGYEFAGWTATSKGESNFENIDNETMEVTIPNNTYGNIELTAHFVGEGVEVAGFYAENIINGNNVEDSIDVKFFPYSELVEKYNINFDDNSTSLKEAFKSDELRKYKGKFVFPSNIERIGTKSCSGIDNITSVVVPKNVTVGDYAFSYCKNLLSVDFKRGGTLGTGAFYNCEKLNQFNSNIAGVCKTDKFEKISDYCFYNDAFTTLKVGRGTKVIGDYAFTNDVSGLEEASGIRSTYYALKNQGVRLADIDFSDTLETIGKGAFNNTVITAVVIPDSVTNIDDYAFSNCNFLKIVKLPKNIKRISKGCFNSCEKLEEIVLPESVTIIDDYAFGYCSQLPQIKLSDNLEYLGTMAFYRCSKFNSEVYIPASVTHVGCAMYVDTSVPAIKVDTNNLNYCDIDGVLFTKDKTMLIEYPESKKGGTYTIPNTVTILESSAFSGNHLGSINIPNSVKEIRGGCFDASRYLTSITIPDSVTTIGNWAFWRCFKLENVVIGSGVKHMGDHNFQTTTKTLKSVTFRNPYGWSVKKWSSASRKYVETGVNVTDPSTNANYLEKVYKDYEWNRR